MNPIDNYSKKLIVQHGRGAIDRWGLSQCPTPFSSVAGDAGRHEIPWRVITLFYERLNVVERQLIISEYFRAVDAAIGIAGKNRRALVVSRL